MNDTSPAEVIKILGRSGVKGVIKTKCKIIDGPDKGKIVSRNVIGPVRKGDILMLKETEMESSDRIG